MRKFLSVIFALILCVSLSVTAFADTVRSNQGGDDGEPTSPRTGSVAVAVLAATACAAGGVGVAACCKSKKEN